MGVHTMLSSILILLAFGVFASTSDGPWEAGPFQPKHKFYNRFLINGLDHELDVWAPDGAGTFPVIYFLGGLGGIIPGIAYDTVMKRIASHGCIVMDPWVLISNPNDTDTFLWDRQESGQSYLQRFHGWRDCVIPECYSNWGL